MEASGERQAAGGHSALKGCWVGLGGAAELSSCCGHLHVGQRLASWFPAPGRPGGSRKGLTLPSDLNPDSWWVPVCRRPVSSLQC